MRLPRAYRFEGSHVLIHREGRAVILDFDAVARAHGLTLVTGNAREFSRVPELPVEDWRRLAG